MKLADWKHCHLFVHVKKTYFSFCQLASEALGYYFTYVCFSVQYSHLDLNHNVDVDTHIILVSRPRGSKAGRSPGYFG